MPSLEVDRTRRERYLYFANHFHHKVYARVLLFSSRSARHIYLTIDLVGLVDRFIYVANCSERIEFLHSERYLIHSRCITEICIQRYSSYIMTN